MVTLYVKLIRDTQFPIENVPPMWREQVREECIKKGILFEE